MILLVDDDTRALRAYCEALEDRDLTPRIVSNVDEALRIIENPPEPIDLIVWDMMMPSGQAFAHEDTWGGLRTGTFFYERMRRTLPNVPSLLFTNMNLDEVEGSFLRDSRHISKMKEELLPSEFADLIEEVLRSPEASGAQEAQR